MPMFNVLAAATVTSNSALIDISAGDTLSYALLGYCVVFLGLVALIIVISIMAKIMVSAAKKPAAAVEVTPAPVEEAPKELAKGSAGDVKLFDVPDRDAAMIMAIVANQMKKPLNELRFKSIKEVK